MVQGRIEPSPAEQLLELRRSRDRYAALADRLHDSADPDLDPAEILAREQNARRIAHAYEKSISNSVMRMSGPDQAHRFALPALGTRTWLMIFVAISVLDGGVLFAHFRPQISRLLPALTHVAKLEWRANPAPVAIATPRPATPPAAPPQSALAESAPAESTPAPVTPPAIAKAPATPAPKPATAQAAPNAAASSAKPASAPPQATTTPAPATPTPAPSTPAPSVPIPSVPIPSARPTSGPVITITPPPTPVTEPPPVAATPAPSPSPPAAATPATAGTPPQTQAPAAPVLTRPQAIAGTHTLPPYPVQSKRRGESGKTQMQVAVSIQGTASGCTVMNSSGSARLDAAACNHVEARWRWKPATRDGQPVAGTTAVTVVWSLLQAPR